MISQQIYSKPLMSAGVFKQAHGSVSSAQKTTANGFFYPAGPFRYLGVCFRRD